MAGALKYAHLENMIKSVADALKWSHLENMISSVSTGKCPEMGSSLKHDQVGVLNCVHDLWSSFFLGGFLHTWQKLSPNVQRDGSMAWKLLLLNNQKISGGVRRERNILGACLASQDAIEVMCVTD